MPSPLRRARQQRGDVPDFDIAALLRRIRRTADLSQRELSRRLDVSKSAVAAAEAGTGQLPASVLASAAALAGLRLALVDAEGREVTGMADGTVRDMSGRRFPAHLDTRYSDEGWWHGDERYSRQRPWYTFDRDRVVRNIYRRRDGTPEDHQLPRPGDSPRDRRAARRRMAREKAEAARLARLAAGEVSRSEDWVCTCPPNCEELDDRNGKPVHAPDCGCQCDLA